MDYSIDDIGFPSTLKGALWAQLVAILVILLLFLSFSCGFLGISDNATCDPRTSGYDVDETLEANETAVTAELTAYRNVHAFKLVGPNGGTQAQITRGEESSPSVRLNDGAGTYHLIVSPEDWSGPVRHSSISVENLQPPSPRFTSTDILNGDGTQNNPFKISTARELQAMRDNLQASYVLVADIDASKTARWDDGSGFRMIGYDRDNRFTGSFDGQGHTITGLRINHTDRIRAALFGWVSEDGVVQNVRLKNATVDGYNSAGVLVGRNYGTVENASASGSVTAGGWKVGGLVAYNTGTVSNSSASASVAGEWNKAGGLVGSNYGTIRDSYATGTVNGGRFSYRGGGLVGVNHGVITDAYAAGSVNAANFVGGLVGENEGVVSNASASGRVNGSSVVGGLVGVNDDASVSNSFATGIVTGNDSVGGLAGQNSDSSISGSYWMDTTTDDDATREVGYSGDTRGVKTGVTIPSSSANISIDFVLDQAKGDSAETELNRLTFGSGGSWRVVDDGYPVVRSIDKQKQLDTR